ncbi:MAG: sugar ABC transporter ATP-binding protein [Mobilitalea sp.]
MSEEVVLKLKNITKRYPGVVALDNVSVDFKKGEIHALLGENGAGKSTLIKVLAGAVQNDEGSIWINGNEYDKMTPILSRNNGVEVIYQEYNLVSGLTVAENVCLGRQMKGIVNKKEMYDITKALFDKYEIDIDPKAYVRDLSSAKQQLVEITKAISKDAQIIVMDEPTAQLTMTEVERLYEIVRNLKAKNKTIIYISHRLDELFAITDSITIMRDGCYVDTVETASTSRDELITLMVGRTLKDTYPKRNCIKEDTIFEVKDISGYYNNKTSFSLKRGEILGFSGLVGAGRTELMRVIFGADRKLTGITYVNGKEVIIKSPQDAIRKGIGLIPEDRKVQGCFMNNTIEWNISIANIGKLTTGGLVDKKKIRKQAEEYKELLNIKTPSLEQLVSNLSGGNQQKVVLAKVLATDSDIIIFDEPTRGIDIGARHEIYILMSKLVESGKSIIMISSDMEELIGMSDRVIILNEGTISGELGKEDFKQEIIMKYASKEV